MSTLSDRIAAILQGEPTSAAVAEILMETAEERARIDQARSQAKAVSLDPVVSADAVKKARADLRISTFGPNA